MTFWLRIRSGIKSRSSDLNSWDTLYTNTRTDRRTDQRKDQQAVYKNKKPTVV